MTQDERTFGMLCHLAALASLVVPCGHVLGPLVIWLVKRNESPFIDAQGKESLNFQISMTIFFVIAGILGLFLGIITCGIGWFLFYPVILIISLLDIIFVILAAVDASNGKYYQYPWSIRFIN